MKKLSRVTMLVIAVLGFLEVSTFDFGAIVLSQAVETSCTDSDDGRNYDISGFVTGIGPSGYTYTKFDACETGAYEGDLKEFYCNGTVPSAARYSCTHGCADGACLPELNCPDEDGDGYSPAGGLCGEVDCDDAAAEVHPGTTEVCDNTIDDDCNGLIDDQDPPCAICTDSDGDGFAQEGGFCGSVDCDDANPAISPGAPEDCQNGIDDNCNGLIDDADPICSAPNVIIIGWDGTQRDHFWECFNRELAECADGLPNLASLADGRIFDVTVTDGETSTKPGWTQILTGYKAEVTGVKTNAHYQPIPEGYTLFEKVENYFGVDSVVTMFISGKNVHTGGACVGDATYDDGLPAIEELGQPWCLTKDHLDYFEIDLRQNSNVTQRALQLLETHQNDQFLAFFLYRDPDVTGHLAGENSIYYTRQILDVDQQLGYIVNAVESLGISQQTLIYVITDHGFDENSNRHHNARYGFLATSDPSVMRDGDRMDLTPTILENLSISLGPIDPAPTVDGYSLSSIPPISCVPEGEAFHDYAGAPMCCAGLNLITFDLDFTGCYPATGGTGDNSGYCTACGNGLCESPENECNCPVDCGP